MRRKSISCAMAGLFMRGKFFPWTGVFILASAIFLSAAQMNAGPATSRAPTADQGEDSHEPSVEDAGRPPQAGSELALVIVVFSPRQGPARVSITFSRFVDHGELARRVKSLAKKAGWETWRLQLRDEPGPKGEMQTSASFSCEGIVNRRQGKLGLEPLVEEFRGEGNFRVAFLVPGMESFTGPTGYEKNGTEVRFFPGKEVYEYEVIASTLPNSAEVEAEVPPAGKGGLAARGAIFAGMVGLAVVVGWLWYGRKRKEQRRQQRNGD